MSGGLSLILPTYNTGDLVGGRLPAVIEVLRRRFDPVEVIVVDDASDDDYREFVSQCAREVEGVRVFRNDHNLGKGVSVWVGVQAATQPRVMFTDADIPFDAESYDRVAAALAAGAPAVVGCRRRYESQILARFDALGYAASRHVVGVVFNHLVRALTGLPYRDTQCGLKAFDRDVALRLFRRVRQARFLFDIELLLAARHCDVPVAEEPVCVIYEDSRSTVRVGFDSWRLGRDLVSLWTAARSGAYARDPDVPLLDRVGGVAKEIESP